MNHSYDYRPNWTPLSSITIMIITLTSLSPAETMFCSLLYLQIGRSGQLNRTNGKCAEGLRFMPLATKILYCSQKMAIWIILWEYLFAMWSYSVIKMRWGQYIYSFTFEKCKYIFFHKGILCIQTDGHWKQTLKQGALWSPHLKNYCMNRNCSWCI